MEARERPLGQEVIRENVDSWQNLMFLYKSAMREVCTKLEILKDEFQNTHRYNPIEYIESRLKSLESIENKMLRHGLEITKENMVREITDIAGVRVVCSFNSDIYKLEEMIREMGLFEILRYKDYIASPKPSGYRSLHLLVKVPVYTTEGTIGVKAEIQIRTIAMDFWASLEHKIQYKFEGDVPAKISKELRNCASIVSMLDEKMLSLNDQVMSMHPEKRVKGEYFKEYSEKDDLEHADGLKLKAHNSSKNKVGKKQNKGA